MSKILFSIIFLYCIILTNAYALNTEEIRKLAALEAHCSREQPCTISISNENGKFIVRVGRSTSISSEGILLFRPGSVVYYIYNSDGSLEKRLPTP
jgi:hypothetical protein